MKVVSVIIKKKFKFFGPVINDQLIDSMNKVWLVSPSTLFAQFIPQPFVDISAN